MKNLLKVFSQNFRSFLLSIPAVYAFCATMYFSKNMVKE